MTDIVERLNDSLSAGYSELRKEAAVEIMRLRAKIEAMERQKPAGRFIQHPSNGLWEQDGYGDNPDARPLYALPGAQAQPAKNAVAYLDLGTGGYMDVGTDLTDEELATLPKGRHMLGIIGTYGVDGYVPAQPAPSVPMDVIVDYLVSISAHLARRDDAKAQAEIGELLKMIASAPKPGASVPEDVMRDAERYRYLRARDDGTAGVGCWIEADGRVCDRGWLYGVQLDSAIDSFIEVLAAAPKPEAKP